MESGEIFSTAEPGRADPVDLEAACIEVDDDSGVFVDAKHRQVFGKFLLQLRKAESSDEAATRVVGTALRIVPVGDHNQFQADSAEDVETLYPVQFHADLVDLVDRQGVSAHGECGGAGGDQAATILDMVDENVRHAGRLQLLYRVGGTTGTHQDIVGFPEPLERECAFDIRDFVVGFIGRDLQLAADPFAEVFHSGGADLIGIELESCRGIEEYRMGLPAETAEEHLVHFDHGRGEFSRAHEYKCSHPVLCPVGLRWNRACVVFRPVS